jgi:hypothetical protein
MFATVPTSPSGSGKIESRRLTDRRNRAGKQTFVHEGAYHGLLAGAVGSDHHVEHETRRARPAGQRAVGDSDGQIGAAEHLRLRRHEAKLVEAHAIGWAFR